MLPRGLLVSTTLPRLQHRLAPKRTTKSEPPSGKSLRRSSHEVQTTKNWISPFATARSLPIRCARLRGLRNRIMASRNELTDAVVRESGKPRVEALFADIFVALDSAEYWSKNAARALRTQRVPHHSTPAKAKRGYLTYEPLGVI